jgi:hypothetical protein
VTTGARPPARPQDPDSARPTSRPPGAVAPPTTVGGAHGTPGAMRIEPTPEDKPPARGFRPAEADRRGTASAERRSGPDTGRTASRPQRAVPPSVADTGTPPTERHRGSGPPEQRAALRRLAPCRRGTPRLCPAGLRPPGGYRLGLGPPVRPTRPSPRPVRPVAGAVDNGRTGCLTCRAEARAPAEPGQCPTGEPPPADVLCPAPGRRSSATTWAGWPAAGRGRRPGRGPWPARRAGSCR